jgi:ATP-binding cassette subfamily F protein uup
MSLITLQNACLAFGHVSLLDHADFFLQPNERVALIGRNGAGKSSLLKVLAQQITLDDGALVRQQNLTWVYVPQEPDLSMYATVFEAVAAGLGEIWHTLQRWQTIQTHLEQGDDSAALLDEMAELQSVMEQHDGWQLQYRIDTVIQQLSLSADAALSGLSGGTLKRVALAQALVQSPDVLLLDEPTNHLDITSIRWLEDLLMRYSGALVFITHDRTFLDALATRVVELDRGNLRTYPGNFSAYQQIKADQLAIEAVENAKFDKLLAQEEIWIRQGVEARRTRSVSRIQRLEDMRQDRQQRRQQQGRVQLSVDEGQTSGKIVAQLEHVDLAFGDKVIVKQLTTTILRGDKLALIGGNGVGKTTLLRLLLGQLNADSGKVQLGTNLEIAYFDQMRDQLRPDDSLLDTISPGSEWIEINGQRKHVMSYLGDFLFAPERARSPVKSLSGGERNRLFLARLFARPANLLVLDEPTNDLDIDSLELLEELLQNYAGTVIIISHDRTFLDNVATSSLLAIGDGAWEEHAGGYTDALQARERMAKIPATPPKTNASATTSDKAVPHVTPTTTSPASPISRKLSYKEKQRLAELPQCIHDLETEQTAIQHELASDSIYRDQPKRVAQLSERLEVIETELLELLSEWDKLEG